MGSKKHPPRESAAIIDGAISNFLAGLGKKNLKLSVTDVMRLMDLRNQLEREQVREVRVTWVESNPELSATNT
jgi:hypothetical protein